MGIIRDGEQRQGVGAAMAMQLTHQALALLRTIAEHLARLVYMAQDRPNMFRAQAAIHRSYSGGASFSAGEVVKVAEANPNRKGLDVRITGPDAVMLALGVQAIADPGANAAGFGMPIATIAGSGTNPVGVWNGKVGNAVWTGELWATVAAPTRSNFELYVTEV